MLSYLSISTFFVGGRGGGDGGGGDGGVGHYVLGWGGGAESEFMFMFSIQSHIIISLMVNLEKKNDIYLYEIYFCFVECGSVHTYCKRNFPMNWSVSLLVS